LLYKRGLLKYSIPILLIYYVIVTSLTFLTNANEFVTFLRIYLFAINTALVALGVLLVINLSRLSRPKPLPELERRFEEELKRLKEEYGKTDVGEA